MLKKSCVVNKVNKIIINLSLSRQINIAMCEEKISNFIGIFGSRNTLPVYSSQPN
uniref:Uncharacterized protein n=1 Tax=Arion vulgaris TaxID=1028688 RepID=A0A0B7A4M1_9EUPU